MGVCGYDKEAAAKRYEQTYALTTVKGVGRLLKDFHKLQSRAYERGDMAAIDIIVDLAEAIEKAALTDKQHTAIRYYYILDLDQEKAASLQGIDISTESRNRKAALERITGVFRKWNYS